jgi:chaperonin GroEL
MKELLFNTKEKKEAFDRIMEGFDATADAVIQTLGPCGRNVLIDDPMQVNITNDGATIANHITFTDNLKNVGAKLVKNSSAKTNEEAGDGTTTTAVLLKSIVHEALESPVNPVFIRRELQEACKDVVAQIKEQSTKITLNDIDKVALISSESEELSSLVTTVIRNVGEKGMIVVEESKSFETGFDIQDGYEISSGFVNPYFVTENGKAVLENSAVLCTAKKISTIKDIEPLFNIFTEKGISQITIVCQDIDDAIIGVFLANKMQGKLSSIVIKTNNLDDIEDVAAATGATVISDVGGVGLEKLQFEHLGLAKKVICSEKKTLFISKTKQGEEWSKRLQDLADNEENEYRKEKILKRIAKLTGGIAIIKVGGMTDAERSYRKDKVDDCVGAVRSALEEGIVEGGGMTLWRIADKMKPKNTGEEILKRSLCKPLEIICQNAGKNYTDIVVNMPKGKGYDAKNDKYVDMIEAGIVDPAKCERCSLENAVGNAGSFITIHCSITDELLPIK